MEDKLLESPCFIEHDFRPIGSKRSELARGPLFTVPQRRPSGCLGCSYRVGLNRFVSIIVGEPWIPAFEQRPERAIERPGPVLQQQVRAALGPLHLLERKLSDLNREGFPDAGRM